MSSLQRLAGELTIDHSNSPGIPADLAAKWASKGVAVAAAGEKFETATYQCPHCSVTVIMNADRKRDRNVCRKCMAIVCDRASCILECQPFDKITDLILAGRAVSLDPVTNLILPAGVR